MGANDSFYKTREWWRLRHKALVRDNFKCVMCGVDVHGKGNNHVDHKIPRNIAPHLESVLNNLQTLCTLCHNQVKQRDERDPNRGVNANGFPNSGGWRD